MMVGPRLYHDASSNEQITKRKKTLSANDTYPAAAPIVVGTRGGGGGGGQSKIFAPFRTIGLVSPTKVPFTCLPLGKTTFQITTSVGRSLQTYDLRRGLNLVFVTRPQTPEDITATVAWKKLVFAAWHGQSRPSHDASTTAGVWVFQRGRKIAELQNPRGGGGGLGQIKKLVVMGEWIVGCGTNKIEVWRTANLEHYTTLQSASSTALSGCICNMPTYLNKICVGHQDGSVELWNLRTGKLLYTLHPPTADFGAITALQPTPALSLLAVAYKSGPVTIRDVRLDKEVMRLNTAGSGALPVTSISFRTDGLGAGNDGRQDGVMATASASSGDITFWDLNKGGRKTGVLRGAHGQAPSVKDAVGGGISKIEFLAGQAVIVSSGLDNSLKSWIFDETPFSPIPRILHSRGGHAAPVSTLGFLPSSSDGCDDTGKWLLSASQDRSLWGWSLRRDGQSTELSQGAIQKKAKKMGLLNGSMDAPRQHAKLEDLKALPISCIACSLNRDGGMGAMPGVNGIWNHSSKTKGQGAKKKAEVSMTGWESIVTGHSGDKTARTWFWGRKRAGRWAFDTSDGSEVKSVAVSPCGTFALIGSAGGIIDMYNLQSGQHRRRFPPRLRPAEAKSYRLQQLHQQEACSSEEPSIRTFRKGEGKHKGAVTGLAVDGLNHMVVSCSEDGTIKFWDFATGILLHEMDWYPMTKIRALRYHRESDLLALHCDDGSIRVVDGTTRKLVRELWISRSHVVVQTVDYTFSNDGRWIISAASDSTVRVWDLPTGHLIDAMRLPKRCNAMAFSPTGEFLATGLSDEVGVHIWTNRTLFTHVPTRQITERDVATVNAPTAAGEGGAAIMEGAVESRSAGEEEEEEEQQGDIVVPVLDQLSDQITTLSLTPKPRWQTLLHLDVIRARNKPKEAPKAPQNAPFFLPSVGPMAGAEKESPSAQPEPKPEPAREPGSRISSSALTSRSRAAASTSEFTRLLAQTGQRREHAPLLGYLASLAPSSAEIAIRTLDVVEPCLELSTFIDALTARLKEKRDYELVQAWMSVFLRIHGGVLAEKEGLVSRLRMWQEEARRERDRLNGLVGYSVGVVRWVRSARRG